MAANKKIAELAYCNVNGITKAEVKNAEHQQIISTALTDVWTYEGLYEGENDALRDKRLDLESPASGNVTDLAQHFKELYPDELSGQVGWAVIFIMYNKLKGSKLGQEASEPKVEEEVVSTQSDEGSSENKTNKLKEATTMANVTEQNLSSLEQLDQDLQTNNESDVNVGTNLPASGDMKAAYAVAQQKYQDEQKERLAFTKNSKVTEFVLAKPAAVKIAVDGENAKGIIGDVDKVFADFCKKAGVEYDAAGNPSFTNVTPDSFDAARAMYDALKAAKEDPGKEFDVYFSKSNGTIKGYKFVDDKGGAGTYIKVQDMIDIIINKAFGIITTPVKGVQLQICKARRQSTNGKKGKGTQKAKDKQGYAGIASIRVSEKKAALEQMGSFWKEIDEKNTDMLPGMKSDMSIRYYRDVTEGDDEKKVGTWRIPLKVKQYKLEIKDKAKEELGTGVSAVGAGAVAINVDDENAMKNLMNDLTEIAAMAAVRGLGGENSAFGEIRKAAEAKVAAEAQSEADELAGANL